MSRLRIAVPRGNLFAQTLDLLDRLDLETREVRENDRRLLFAEAGIVTMRPSDVPTYVEAGAADLGITGKDVLLEQSEREVYELADLGYGECKMVLATAAGEDRAARPAICPHHHFRARAGRGLGWPAPAHRDRQAPGCRAGAGPEARPGRRPAPLCARTGSWSGRRSPPARHG